MLILVDFKDKSLYRLIEEVTRRLSLYGFDCYEDDIPADAIACALDEVRKFNHAETYREILIKVEAAIERRRAQHLSIYRIESEDFASQSQA